MTPEKTSLWKQIGRETVWGRRGLVKANSLWLPLSFFLLEKAPEGGDAILLPCLLILSTVWCWVLVSILANDLSDCPADAAAGKYRWICNLSYAMSWGIVISLSATGLGIASLAKNPEGVRWAYLGAVLLGLIYSLKPFRLKEIGAWGILVYSSACALAYVVIPWAWLQPGWAALLVLCPAVFLDKWVNLHFHQILDYEQDAKKLFQTYAVRAGIERARRSLRWAAALASAALVAVFVLAVFLLQEERLLAVVATLAAAGASAFYVISARKNPLRQTALLRELPWPYLSLAFAVLRVLPLGLLAWLAWKNGSLWGVFGPALAFFVLESLQSYGYRYE